MGKPAKTIALRNYRVFLASPSDVADERAIAMKVIDQLPYDPFLRDRATIGIVAWDKLGGPAMEANLKPQEAISRGLPKPSECDIFVGIFWSRMGTPTEVDGRSFLSGSHYEYEEALAASNATGDRPRLVLYRRDEKLALDPDAPDFDERLRQHNALREFFNQFKDPETDQLTGGVNSYSTPDAFGELLESHLKGFIYSFLEDDDSNEEIQAEPPLESEYSETHVPERWDGSPFPGLRPLTEEEEPIFFGRGREIDALSKRVRQSPITAVVGASGSGKSSLVRAGLIPRLLKTAGEEGWLRVSTTPDHLGGGDPFQSLAAASLRDLPGIRSRRLGARLKGDAGEFSVVCREALDASPASRLLFFVDQFEELFTTVKSKFIDRFVQLLAEASRTGFITVVLTVRGDFFGQCLDTPGLASLLQATTFPLGAPRQVNLFEMITRPALRAGLLFEKGLADRILDDTGAEPGSLALMAYALDELYRACDGTGSLTHAAYDGLGGVQGAIGERSESVFQTLDPDARAALPHVFRELVEVDDRGTATRRRETLKRVSGSKGMQTFVDRMTDARLLVQNRDENNTAYVEVAHEALLRSWTRLAEWIEATQDDLRLLRQVRTAAEDWSRSGRDSAYRWPHERLALVYRMRDNLAVKFEPAVEEFVAPEFDRLMKEYRDSNAKARAKLNIIDRLEEIGSGAAPYLVRILERDTTTPVIQAAGKALAPFADQVIKPLLKIASVETTQPKRKPWEPIRNQAEERRMSALKALTSSYESPIVPALISLLDIQLPSGGEKIVVEQLGRIADTSAEEALLRVVERSNWRIVGPAAKALASVGSKSASSILLPKLHSANRAIARLKMKGGRMFYRHYYECDALCPLVIATGKLGDGTVLTPLRRAESLVDGLQGEAKGNQLTLRFRSSPSYKNLKRALSTAIKKVEKRQDRQSRSQSPRANAARTEKRETISRGNKLEATKRPARRQASAKSPAARRSQTSKASSKPTTSQRKSPGSKERRRQP